MRTLKPVAGLGILGLVLGASASCGDAVRQGRAPVYLVIDSLQGANGSKSSPTFVSAVLSDVVANLTTPPPCSTDAPCPTVFDDPGQVVLHSNLKNLGTVTTPTVPTPYNEVTIYRVHVEYVRADGHNVPGVDVPYPWDGAATGTVPQSGQITLGFELVPHTAKLQSPLYQMRGTSIILTTIANVTFYGKDQAGNDVTVTGSIQVNFGNFGDS